LKFISWPMRKGVMWPLNCFLFRCGMLMVSIFSVASLLFSRFALWKGINKSTASRARQREGDIVNHDSEMCQQTSNNSHGHNSLGSRKKKSWDLKPRSQIPDPSSQIPELGTQNPMPGPQLHQLSQDIAHRTSVRAANF